MSLREQALATANGEASGVIVRGVSRDDLRHLTLVYTSMRAGSALDQFDSGCRWIAESAGGIVSPEPALGICVGWPETVEKVTVSPDSTVRSGLRPASK